MQTMNALVTLVEGGAGGWGNRDDRGAHFTSPSRGTKRNASESRLSDWERFEKRLRTLSLQNNQNALHKHRKARQADNTPTPQQQQQPPAPRRIDPQPSAHDKYESMHVDDTPNRVYISDLDAELSSSDDDDDESPSEDRLIFLPDIEKRFSRIPQQVLIGRRHDADEDEGESRDLVLYGVPKSLTAVDEGHDSVRKAILEARQRAREQVLATVNVMTTVTQHHDDGMIQAEPNPNWENDDTEAPDYDPDAMDLG